MEVHKMKDFGVHLTLEFCEVSVPFSSYEQVNQTFGFVTEKPNFKKQTEPFFCGLVSSSTSIIISSIIISSPVLVRQELKVHLCAGEALTPPATLQTTC